jgi:hypothetical protein
VNDLLQGTTASEEFANFSGLQKTGKVLQMGRGTKNLTELIVALKDLQSRA